MSQFILAEEDIPGFDYSYGQLVGLTPWACAAFKAKKIPYSTIEDYYSEEEMRRGEVVYFYEQLQWFKAFDEFLKEKNVFLKQHDLDLASAYHNRFIYLVDSLVIRHYVLDQFIKKNKPTELIVLYSACKTDEALPALEVFSRKDRWSYVPLIRLMADKLSIPVQYHEVDSSVTVTKDVSLGLLDKSRLGVLWSLKKIKKWLEGIKKYPIGDGGTAIFFPETGNFATHEVSLALKNAGYRVLTRHDVPFSQFRDGPAINRPVQLEDIFKDFKKTSIFSWINGSRQIDLASLAEPYIEHFIKVQCPSVQYEVAGLVEFYQQNNVAAVIAHASVGTCTSPLLAAKVQGIPRVCFQHSVGAADSKSWCMDELNLFDYNFAMNTISKEYFQANLTGAPKSNCVVLEAPLYLRNIQKRFPSKEKPLGIKPRLLYCPSKLANGLAHLNTFYYPMAWYFEFQCRILTHLSQVSDYQIIYKHADGQEWAARSIMPWLRSRHFENVTVVTGPLTQFFNRCDRILFEYPSTGFFEALAAKKTVLSLYHEAVKIWGPLRDAFGSSLQPYSSTDDALRKISLYLKGPESDFQPNLEMTDADYFESLKCIFEGRMDLYNKEVSL